jgi:feruloyl esterase
LITPKALQLFDEQTGTSDGYNPELLLNRYSGYVGALNKKIIMYHGYSDDTITSYRSVAFYEQYAASAEGYEHAQRNIRLFMAPGMFHCGGGPGPNTFNTLEPLEEWIENDMPPDSIVATNTGSLPASGPAVGREMPLCKWPEMATYSGKGNVYDVKQWHCDSSDRRMLRVGVNGRQAGLPNLETAP